MTFKTSIDFRLEAITTKDCSLDSKVLKGYYYYSTSYPTPQGETVVYEGPYRPMLYMAKFLRRSGLEVILRYQGEYSEAPKKKESYAVRS